MAVPRRRVVPTRKAPGFGLRRFYVTALLTSLHLCRPPAQAFIDEVKTGGQQLSLVKLEERFNVLCERYPKAEHYMKIIHKDRHCWAENVSLDALIGYVYYIDG